VDALLGTMPDKKLVRRLQRTYSAIAARRQKLGIPHVGQMPGAPKMTNFSEPVPTVKLPSCSDERCHRIRIIGCPHLCLQFGGMHGLRQGMSEQMCHQRPATLVLHRRRPPGKPPVAIPSPTGAAVRSAEINSRASSQVVMMKSDGIAVEANSPTVSGLEQP
jgi:hypothetical protein